MTGRAFLRFLGLILFLGIPVVFVRGVVGAAETPAVAAADAGQKAAGPKGVLAEDTFDFGAVEQGTVVEHEFKITNQGDAPLLLQGVQPACGCTVAEYSTAPIAPGGEGVIKARFDTTGFQGSKVKTLRVFSNDPGQSSFTLSIKGSVLRDVEVSPPRLYFGTVARGKTVSTTVKVTFSPPSQIRAVGAETRSEFLDVETEALSSGDGVQLRATLKPNAPLGILRDRIAVKTTSDKTPVVNVPVFARVEGELRLVPADVSFGLLPGPLNEDISEKVLLRNVGSADFKILSVKSDNSAVKAEVVGQSGKDYELKVAVAAGSTGAIKGRITIKTDYPDPDQQELVLPVFGLISQKGA